MFCLIVDADYVCSLTLFVFPLTILLFPLTPSPLPRFQMFAERIVVKAIVQSLAGGGSPSPPAGTKVRAVLHEGLV